MKIPFGEQAYATRSLNAFFAEVNPPSSKDNIITYPTPGYLLFVEIGTGPIRGMIELNGDLYAVSGQAFFKIDISGASTNLGTVAGARRVSMSRNDLEIIMVNGAQGYTYSAANGFAQITDPDFIRASTVGYLSRRFILPRDGTNQFNISDAFDGTAYDPLNFSVTITNPENIVAILTDHAEAWFFGEKSINIWIYNQQEVDFPFTEMQGANIEKGCGAIYTPVKLDNTVYWLGDDQSIYAADGYRPLRISTHAIDQAIRHYSATDDAFAYGYHEDGHPFYVITFPSGDATWVFDASQRDPNQAWHARQSGQGGRHVANAYAKAFNKHFIGDYRNGKIYETSLSHYTDDGATIYRTAMTPAIHSERKRVFMDRLEIDIESGEGLTTGQGSDPQAMLTYSDDGGQTWSTERTASIGKIGEYRKRLKFHNLGTFYQRIFKLRISDPIRSIIIDANAKVETE